MGRLAIALQAVSNRLCWTRGVFDWTFSCVIQIQKHLCPAFIGFWTKSYLPAIGYEDTGPRSFFRRSLLPLMSRGGKGPSNLV